MGDDVFVIVNVRRYRTFIIVLITLILVLYFVMFPQVILRFFYPLKYSDIIVKNANEYELDPYLVMAIIRVESNYQPEANSHKGAKGLMQLTDETAQDVAKGLKVKNFYKDMIYEPEINIRFGCWYLDHIRDYLTGITNAEVDLKKDSRLLLAAYNGGIGNVRSWLGNEQYSKSGRHLDRIPYKETEQYVVKVLREYQVYKKLYSDKL